jgi:hypothetical protein
MGVSGGPYIVRDSSLVLELDAADRNSYVSGSTTWRDLAPNSFTGSLVNGPIFSSASLGSIVFDGVDEYVNLESARAQILTYTSSVTFDIVFNMSQWVNNFYNGVFVLGRNPDPGGGTQCYFLSYIDITGRFVAQFGNSNGTPGNGISSPLQIQTNTIYNFTTTYNNGTGSLYQNSTLVSTAINATSTIYNTNQNNFYIGGDSRYNPATSGRYFKGSVHNVKIYNRALTSSEILQNYNSQKSRFNL